MAKVKLTPPIASLRGKIGPDENSPVIYEVEGRAFIKSSANVNDPETPLQLAYRAAMQRVSREYKKLTLAQVRDWEAYTAFLRKRGSCLYRAPRRVYGAFQQVNIHRLIAGQTVVLAAPEAEVVRVPDPEPVVEHISNDALRIRFSHGYGQGKAMWRVHVSPPLRSAAMKAEKSTITSASDFPQESYHSGQEFDESIQIQTKFTYEVGDTLGLEILGLSPGYTPGEKVVWRRIEVV